MIPELSLWRRSAIVFLAAVTALFGLGLVCEPPPSQAFRDFNLQRVRAFRAEHEPRHPRTLRVVLLGSSRLKNATLAPDAFDEVGETAEFERIEAFRLVANWAVFATFEPLLDDVRALRPDVYVIQMDLLGDEMARPLKVQISFNYLRWLVSGSGSWSWYDAEREQLARVCTDEQTPDQRLDRAEANLVIDVESKSARRARDFIRTAIADGARVVLVSVPKTQAFERTLPSIREDMLASARNLAAELPQVTVVPYAGVLSDEHFCDVTHLNDRGAAVYSRWLIDQIMPTRL
jgi:hypothetical protein